MNRKIALSGISILASLVLIGVGVYAQFIASATSSGSTFSSGNPTLQLCNAASDGSLNVTSCGTQIQNPINVTDLVPGVAKTFTFWLNNTGTDTLTPLTTIFSSPSITGPGTLENDLNVSIACDASSGNAAAGPAKFNVWETTVTLANGTLAGGTPSQCVLTVELPPGNTDVNQVLHFNATFNGQAGT